MALRSLTAATLAAAAAASGELHCLGRVAHEIQSSELDLGSVVVSPAPDRDRECEAHLGDEERHFCVGVNHDETCRAAKNPHIPLPMHAHCEGCFLGTSTDVFYHLNITGFQLQRIGVGLRGTTSSAQLQLSDDAGWAGQPRTGSTTFGEKPVEFIVKLDDDTSLFFKLEMPTRIYYEALMRENVHGALGAVMEFDMGDNYVEYQKDQGWVHKKDTPKWHFKPAAHEGDYDALANLTVGFESSLRLELGDPETFAWYHLDMSSEVPIGLTSVGASGDDTLHSCVDLGMKFDVTHEADFNLGSLMGLGIKKHFGPVTDHYRDGSVVHECRDLHPDRPSVVVLV